MSRIMNTTDELVYHIISEPGDGLRYEYAFILDQSVNGYRVWSENEAIVYPEIIEDWVITKAYNAMKECLSQSPYVLANLPIIVELAWHLKCNPHTLREIVITIQSKNKIRRNKMAGPCLCGDPYCPSCGDPSMEAYDREVDKMIDTWVTEGFYLEELKIYHKVGLAAVNACREAEKRTQRNRGGK